MNPQRKDLYVKAFGRRLRHLRLQQGLGMREFADLAGIEYSQLSKIERGVTNPTLSTILVLADTLGVVHSELFGFEFPISN